MAEDTISFRDSGKVRQNKKCCSATFRYCTLSVEQEKSQSLRCITPSVLEFEQPNRRAEERGF